LSKNVETSLLKYFETLPIFSTNQKFGGTHAPLYPQLLHHCVGVQSAEQLSRRRYVMSQSWAVTY